MGLLTGSAGETGPECTIIGRLMPEGMAGQRRALGLAGLLLAGGEGPAALRAAGSKQNAQPDHRG